MMIYASTANLVVIDKCIQNLDIHPVIDQTCLFRISSNIKRCCVRMSVSV